MDTTDKQRTKGYRKATENETRANPNSMAGRETSNVIKLCSYCVRYPSS